MGIPVGEAWEFLWVCILLSEALCSALYRFCNRSTLRCKVSVGNMISCAELHTGAACCHDLMVLRCMLELLVAITRHEDAHCN